MQTSLAMRCFSFRAVRRFLLVVQSYWSPITVSRGATRRDKKMTMLLSLSPLLHVSPNLSRGGFHVFWSNFGIFRSGQVFRWDSPGDYQQAAHILSGVGSALLWAESFVKTLMNLQQSMLQEMLEFCRDSRQIITKY